MFTSCSFSATYNSKRDHKSYLFPDLLAAATAYRIEVRHHFHITRLIPSARVNTKVFDSDLEAEIKPNNLQAEFATNFAPSQLVERFQGTQELPA